MATLLLTVGAAALTEGMSAWIALGIKAAAVVAGSYIDQQLFGPGPTTQEGPRLDNLQVQASTEGAALPEIAGRARIAGQIVWATKFREVATTQTTGGGKGLGGGPRTTTTSYSYFANFAVGLSEGPIDRIGRVWADGKPLDMTNIVMRVYRGSADQLPDSFVEGIEGLGNAPAYRHTAYVVFENFALEKFGNRIPQLNFEVFRRVSVNGLEDLVEAITIIPGGGEHVYDTVVETRNLGGGATMPQNKFVGGATSDWSVAIDDLQASLPNVNIVLLVVGWFGDDLRAGSCTVRPKVEVADKTTTPNPWVVHGLARTLAAVVTTAGGRPAYGGTPSGDSVVRAVRDLKRRGLSVVFYPFLFMDIASGNALPDPRQGSPGCFVLAHLTLRACLAERSCAISSKVCPVFLRMASCLV